MHPAKPSYASSSAPATGVPIVGVTSTPAAAGIGTGVEWSSALCDCMTDLGVCCMTCWFPCVTFGRVAVMVDRGETSCCATGTIYAVLCCFVGCSRFYTCTYRSKMRAQYELPEEPCCDCCVAFCCEPCALCQHYRHLKAKGFKPELGWNGNLKRGAGAGAMYPPAAQGMCR